MSMMEQVNYLHVEELIQRFEAYDTISVDEFYKFYKEIFENIKRNTVSWYIYELKKRGIVRHVSRGKYTLVCDKKQGEETFLVITMDIIGSTRKEHFYRDLKEKIAQLNEIMHTIYGQDRKYQISQGDEIQILLPFRENIGDIFIITLCLLHPFKVRYGMGIGSVEMPVTDNSWEMNGPVFWNARDQLEQLKKSKGYDGRVFSGYSRTDSVCNRILVLINKSLDKITRKQWDAIQCEFSQKSVEKAIEQLGITKSSYYERLDTSNIHDIHTSFTVIYDVILMREEIR